MNDGASFIEPKRLDREAASAGAPSDDDLLSVRLEEVAATLRHLAELASRQRDLVEGDESQPLLDLLSERQDAVDRLADPVRGLGSVVHAFGAVRRRPGAGQLGGAGAPPTEQVVGLIDEIESLLARVIESDQADQRRLERRLREIEGELATNRTAQAAVTAYAGRVTTGPTSIETPRFTDRKG